MVLPRSVCVFFNFDSCFTGAAACDRYLVVLHVHAACGRYDVNNIDVRKIVDDYDSRSVPLDVFVLDMNWHKKDDWSGYSWDTNLFPIRVPPCPDERCCANPIPCAHPMRRLSVCPRRGNVRGSIGHAGLSTCTRALCGGELARCVRHWLLGGHVPSCMQQTGVSE